jgi:acyl-CoA thioesterase FadM
MMTRLEAVVFDTAHQEVLKNNRLQAAFVVGQELRMPRIKLSEQEVYEFQSSFQVRPQDINYGGHVGNDNLISLVGAARAHLFHSLGFSELDLGDRQTGIIITDLVVNYKAEAFLFDELLIETHIGEVAPKRFRMFHRIRKDMKLIALVETGFATYNYETKKTTPIPTSFLKCLAGR